jgi:hypothetical protein
MCRLSVLPPALTVIKLLNSVIKENHDNDECVNW